MHSAGPTAPKLVYLGFAFPPGVAGLHPEAQPAGHFIETNMVNSLRPWFQVRSVGISWIDVAGVPPGDPSPGLPHSLNLLDKPPELFHRWNSLRRLQRQFEEWQQDGWVPDVLLACNFSPVYNAFIRRLKRRPHPPCTILYLADSVNLQRSYRWARRLRHRLKPWTWPDSEMAGQFNGCAAVSIGTKPFFGRRGMPWFWLPNGCDPSRALPPPAKPLKGPTRFAYFGTLAPHGGVLQLLQVFAARERPAELHICGFGKSRATVTRLCRGHTRVRFYEPRSPDHCLRFAQENDVLVNPRPIFPGNENNISSKVFEYALSARAILTSRVSGVDQILGEEAFYFDAEDFDRSLDSALERVAAVPREELNRRGLCLQHRLVDNYSWARQGEELARFLQQVLQRGRRGPALGSPPVSLAFGGD